MHRLPVIPLQLWRPNRISEKVRPSIKFIVWRPENLGRDILPPGGDDSLEDSATTGYKRQELGSEVCQSSSDFHTMQSSVVQIPSTFSLEQMQALVSEAPEKKDKSQILLLPPVLGRKAERISLYDAKKLFSVYYEAPGKLIGMSLSLLNDRFGGKILILDEVQTARVREADSVGDAAHYIFGDEMPAPEKYDRVFLIEKLQHPRIKCSHYRLIHIDLLEAKIELFDSMEEAIPELADASLDPVMDFADHVFQRPDCTASFTPMIGDCAQKDYTSCGVYCMMFGRKIVDSSCGGFLTSDRVRIARVHFLHEILNQKILPFPAFEVLKRIQPSAARKTATAKSSAAQIEFGRKKSAAQTRAPVSLQQ